MNSRENQLIQTLRLSDREKAKLVWAIEETSRCKVDSTQRRLRVTCTNNEAVLTLIGDNGSRTRLAVLNRDLSRWGASIIHGRYIYPGSRCELEVQALDKTWHMRAGEIRHIRHVQGLIHNMGIRFDDPIDLGDFVVLSPEEESRHLQELADDLPEGELDLGLPVTHRVLIVDDYPSDRKLFGYWLSRAGMEVATVVDSTTAAQRVAESRFGLLVIDAQLGKESGADLIRELRNAEFFGPILAVSANEEEQAKTTALEAGANGFLVKPFTAEQLIEAAEGLLGLDADSETEPIFSQFNDDQEMRPLLSAFTRGLASYIDQLYDANSSNDYETLAGVARTLKGAGTGYGLEPISLQAGGVLLSLNENAEDMDKIRQSVNELIGVLARVKLR